MDVLSGSDKFWVTFMLIFAWILVLASVAIFFIPLYIRAMLGLLFLSHVTHLYAIQFTLGFSQSDPSRIDASFSRLRAYFLFSAFFQVVVYIFSFSEGELGSTCTEEHPLPYGLIAMYGF